MTDPDDTLEGMGAEPHGPSFVRWTPVERSEPGSPRTAYRPPAIGPPRSRVPALVSVLVIALVAVVVAVASLVAHRADTLVSPTPPPPVSPPSVSVSEDRIDFISADGTGQLVLLGRSWVTDGPVPPTSGSYLRVEVELICITGQVDYDPYHFQAFDQAGHVFEMAAEGTDGRVLDVGTLGAGERVRGVIAFDMPRGDTTLIMSDDSDQTVTALRVPD
jgi:hypothetical protein